MTPRDWAKFAANSVGYVVLAVAIVIAFGALSGVVYMYAELVSFISGVCFSNPSLHERLAKEHPALLRVIDQQPEADEATPDVAEAAQRGQALGRRSDATADRVRGGRGGRGGARGRGGKKARRASATAAATSEDVQVPTEGQHCIFCQAAPAVHMLPACEAWGHTPAWVRSKPARNWSDSSVAGGGVDTHGAHGGTTTQVVPDGQWYADSSTRADNGGDDGGGGSTHGEAWLPSTVHSADFGTGTVLSTVSAPATTRSTPSGGLRVAPDVGDGSRVAQSGDHGERPYTAAMCTPYASVHQHRTELSLKVRCCRTRWLPLLWPLAHVRRGLPTPLTHHAACACHSYVTHCWPCGSAKPSWQSIG